VLLADHGIAGLGNTVLAGGDHLAVHADAMVRTKIPLTANDDVRHEDLYLVDDLAPLLVARLPLGIAQLPLQVEELLELPLGRPLILFQLLVGTVGLLGLRGGARQLQAHEAGGGYGQDGQNSLHLDHSRLEPVRVVLPVSAGIGLSSGFFGSGSHVHRKPQMDGFR